MYICKICGAEPSHPNHDIDGPCEHAQYVNVGIGIDASDIGTASQLGADSEIVTNEAGGKQSKLDYRCDLLDAKTMLRLAAILDYGAKRYESNNWRKIPVQDHINHALVHVFAYLSGDHQDDHLGHALCRLMFACATEKQPYYEDWTKKF